MERYLEKLCPKIKAIITRTVKIRTKVAIEIIDAIGGKETSYFINEFSKILIALTGNHV